jgi:hypothetical protein
MPEIGPELAEQVGSEGFEIAEPDCVAEDFGDEVVVLNSATGVYFSLTDLAAGVWRDLMAGHSVNSLISGIGGVDKHASQATLDFIRNLEAAGLLRQRSAPVSIASSAKSIALATAGKTRLTIESFDDMKDLILADPIHDVDEEIGWPTRPRTRDM